MQTRRHKARDVRHVHHEQAAGLLGDGPQAFKVDGARVGRRTRQQQLGLVLQCQTADFFIIDALVLFGNAIGHDVVQLAGLVYGGTMGQMAAVGEVHAQNRITRLQKAEIHREVCLCAGMGLHVGMFRAEKLARAVARQIFNNINILAAAVIALARITFSIFVGQMAAHRRHHSGGDKVF